MADDIRIGTAGWAAPRDLDVFPAEGTGLERYAAVFDCVEINSSFYRPHRRQTYERWAASTPADFRFAVKVPRTITHEQRLVDFAEPLARFLDECGGLGEKRGPLLVQLPPSLKFEPEVVERFLTDWRKATEATTVLEPRHPTWFDEPADAMLRAFEVARVAADPAVVPTAGEPGGWTGLTYWRLHGSPVMYASAYDAQVLKALAGRMIGQAWCVFDNTRSGAATTDALALITLQRPTP